jgi:hypothetical protein
LQVSGNKMIGVKLDLKGNKCENHLNVRIDTEEICDSYSLPGTVRIVMCTMRYKYR